MARPQIENGKTEFANELLEAIIKTHFSPAEMTVLLAVARKTYGWHKKADRISFTQFEELTGMDRWQVSRTLRILISRHVITRSGAGYALEYGIQKDYELWTELPKKTTAIVDDSINDFVDNTVNEIVDDSINKSSSVPGKIVDDLVQKNDETVNKIVDGLRDSQKQESNYTKANNNSGVAEETFEKFVEGLVIEFSDLDVASELQKWQLYWSEDRRRQMPSRPKSSFRRWLEQERRWKAERESNAKAPLVPQQGSLPPDTRMQEVR